MGIEHLHLLVSEPERNSLAVAIQMLKQVTARKLRPPNSESPFWQRRYYDFNVWKRAQGLREARLHAHEPSKAGSGEASGAVAAG